MKPRDTPTRLAVTEYMGKIKQNTTKKSTSQMDGTILMHMIDGSHYNQYHTGLQQSKPNDRTVN